MFLALAEQGAGGLSSSEAWSAPLVADGTISMEDLIRAMYLQQMLALFALLTDESQTMFLTGGGAPIIGYDKYAIHDNEANEIHAVTLKAVVGADELIVEDSAATWAKKRVTAAAVAALGGGTDPNAIHDNVANEILPVALKAVPAGADPVLIEDTAAANVKKHTTCAAIAALGGGPPAAHALGGALHSADTIANVNSKLSDGSILHTAYTLDVGPDLDHPTIVAALTAAGLLALGPTQWCLIRVAPGNYIEVNPVGGITLVDYCCILGIGGAEATRVRPTNAADAIFQSGAAGIAVLRGLTLQGCTGSGAGDAAVWIDAGTETKVIDCNFEGNYYDVRVDGVGVVAKVQRCYAIGADVSMACSSTSTIHVEDSYLDGAGGVVGISQATGTVYSRNNTFINWQTAYSLTTGNPSLYIRGGSIQGCVTGIAFANATPTARIDDVAFRSNTTDVLYSAIGILYAISCNIDPDKITWFAGSTYVACENDGSQYVVRVSKYPEVGCFADPVAASDFLQGMAIGLTQRGLVKIAPGLYTLTASCDLANYIDIEGTGDSPEAVQIYGAAATSVFTVISADWSLRNVKATANGAAVVIDGGEGTLGNIILVGGTSGTVSTKANLTFEGRCILRSIAATTSLLDVSGADILAERLELDDSAGSGAGIDIEDSVMLIEYLDAYSTAAAGDGIYTNHVDDDITIWDGRIVGWQDAIHCAVTGLAMELGPLVINGGTNDINAVGRLSIISHGTRYSTAKVGTPGNLTTYGSTLDQNQIVQRRCYVRDNAGSIVLVSLATTDITWDTAVIEDAGSWDHNPGGAGTAIVELCENSTAGITVAYDLCFEINAGDDSPVSLTSMLLRSTGGGAYSAVDGSSDSVILNALNGYVYRISLHRTLGLSSQVDGDRYKIAVTAEFDALNVPGTVADCSGVIFTRNY